MSDVRLVREKVWCVGNTRLVKLEESGTERIVVCSPSFLSREDALHLSDALREAVRMIDSEEPRNL